MYSELNSACTQRSGESAPDQDRQKSLYQVLWKEMDQILIQGQQLMRNLPHKTGVDYQLSDDHWGEINRFIQKVDSIWPFWKQEALLQGVRLEKLDFLEKTLNHLADRAFSFR